MIIRKIADSCRKHSTRDAFYINGTRHSYKQLCEQVAGITRIVSEQIPQKGACIGIIENNDIETYAAILAVLFSGNCYVILNPHNPLARNQTIVEATGMQLILASTNGSINQDLSKQVPVHSTKGLTSQDDLFVEEAAEDALAYIIFTSGSTGTPKGVPISRKNLNAFYQAYLDLGMQLDETDRMLQMFDLCFDVSVVSTLFPLTLGACVYTVPMEGVKYMQVYELLEDEDLTFAAIPPSLLNFLRPYFGEISLPNLKYLILTAEASNVQLVKDFRPSIPNTQVINLYGPTEATIYCTAYSVPESRIANHNGMMGIGHPFKNMTTLILDEQMNEVAHGEKGEFCVSGPQVMRGYWKDAEKSDEVLFSKTIGGKEMQFYRTGDLVYQDPDGNIIYCGRKDYQVQVQGFRVELSEIEHVARQFARSANCVVVPKPNDNGNLELFLFMEKYTGEKAPLLSFMKEKLPPYMLPKEVHCLNDFPLNNSGKVDRKKLCTFI